jgi:hypothetical protein
MLIYFGGGSSPCFFSHSTLHLELPTTTYSPQKLERARRGLNPRQLG